MKQEDVLILHGGRVRADAEGVDDAVGLHDLQHELPFGFRDGFPGAAQRRMPAPAGVILLERPVTTAEDSRLLAVCSDGRPDVAGRHHQQRNLLAKTFGDGDGAREQGLLVVAENLLGGKIVGGGAEPADAGGHHDHVLFVGVGALQHPAQVGQRVVVADRNQHVAGADAEGFALDACRVCSSWNCSFICCVRRERVCCGSPFRRTVKISEEDHRKDHAADRGDRFGEQIHDGGGEQHHDDRSQSDRDFDASRW